MLCVFGTKRAFGLRWDENFVFFVTRVFFFPFIVMVKRLQAGLPKKDTACSFLSDFKLVGLQLPSKFVCVCVWGYEVHGNANPVSFGVNNLIIIVII